MEGVGARLGRSSTRYVPATVFTGPVRRWKKKWVHAPSSSSSPNHHAAADRAVNTASHLLLYKWTPIKDSAIQGIYNSNTDSNASNAAAEEPVKKKFKYIPVSVRILHSSYFSYIYFFHTCVLLSVIYWERYRIRVGVVEISTAWWFRVLFGSRICLKFGDQFVCMYVTQCDIY